MFLDNVTYQSLRLKVFNKGAIAQLIEQWSRIMATRVGNQGDALVPFGKALILITRSLGEDLKLSVLCLLTNKHLCFLNSQVK